MAFTEYDLVIGISLYASGVVNWLYSAWYYARNPIPLVVPDDDEYNIARQKAVIWKHRRLKSVASPLQVILLSGGTFLIFGLEIGFLITVMTVLAMIDSFLSKGEENFPVDYLLMRVDAVKVADYAIRDELSHFVEKKHVSDEDKIRVLDYLMFRDDLVAEIARAFKEELCAKEHMV